MFIAIAGWLSRWWEVDGSTLITRADDEDFGIRTGSGEYSHINKNGLDFKSPPKHLFTSRRDWTD